MVISGILTQKEWVVLYLRKEGRSQAAISDHLGVCQSAVSRAETNARAKIIRARRDLALLERLGITIIDDQPADLERRVVRLKHAIRHDPKGKRT
jgi:transcriptional regulator